MSSNKIIWTDLETTGLDAVRYDAIEIACIATDDQLNELGRFHRVLEAPPLETWEKWPLDQHTNSGLLAECRESGIEKAQAEGEWLDWLFNIEDDPKTRLTMAGGGVHFDYRFVQAKWLNVFERFRYRLVDISVIRTSRNLALGRDLEHGFPPKDQRPHRAMPDIEMSLEAARTMWPHLAAANRQQQLENAMAALLAAHKDHETGYAQDALRLLEGESGAAMGRAWSCKDGKINFSNLVVP